MKLISDECENTLHCKTCSNEALCYVEARLDLVFL